MEVILHASSQDDFARLLAQIDIDVPGRSEGRRNHHAERYCMAHFLATFPQARLEFPLAVTHTDKPDFVLSMPNGEIGVEHTEAVPENVARAQSLREKGLGPEMYFIPHANPGEPRKTAEELRQEIEADDGGDGWVGDSAEHEWEAAMCHHIRQKLSKATAHGFSRFEQNWLLVYDNWPLPHINFGKAANLLLPRAKEMNAFKVFDAIFVLNDSHMCELRDSPIVYKLGSPSRGS